MYQRMIEGKFPKPVKLGDRAVGWVESEILSWIQTQVDFRDHKARTV